MARLYCANGPNSASLFQAGPATLGRWPSSAEQSKGVRPTAALAVAQRWKWWHSGGDGRGRKKGGSTVGGGLYSYQRWWTEGGAAVKPGVGKRWWGSHGCSKAAAEISGGRGSDGSAWSETDSGR
jgi:hypothetical protein